MKPLKGVISEWRMDDRGRITGVQIFGKDRDDTEIQAIITSEVVAIHSPGGKAKIAETGNSCYVLV